MAVTLMLRNDLEANWVLSNPVLYRNEIALCTDRAYFKVGDGVSPWDDLKIYFDIKEVLDLLAQVNESVERIEQVRIEMENALQACVDIVTEKTGIDDLESGRATTYSSAKIEEMLDSVKDKNYIIVDTESDRDAIPLKYRKTGMLCFCREFDDSDAGMMFQLVGGTDNMCWVVAALGGSSGGDSGVTAPVIESTFTGNAFPVGEDVVIPYEWYSPNIGRGTLTVLVNNEEFLTEIVSQGNNKVTLSGLKSGSYTIRLSVKDRGNLYTDSLSFVLRVGGLELSSTFNPDQELTVTSVISIPVQISTISLEPIYLTYTVDGIPTRIIGADGYNRINLDALNVGVHTVTILAESSVYISNVLEYRLVVTDSSTLLLVNNGGDTIEAMQGNNIAISYRVSMEGQDSFNASYFINDEKQKDLVIKKGTVIWTVSDLALGEQTLKVVVSLLDGSDSKEFSVLANITEALYAPIVSITDASLELYLDARDKSNDDLAKSIWEDRSEHGRNANLYGYNYNTNGWINQSLTCNGETYAKIPYKPLYDDAPTGITIDMMINIEDAGQQEACVFDLRGASSRRIGISVSTEKALLTLGSAAIATGISQGVDTKLTFVVDRIEKMAYIYVNGIMSEVIMIGPQESISSDSDIYLGCSTILSDSLIPNMYSNSNVKTIRIYSRALDYMEVVQNYIADIWNMDEQIEERKKSYENEMPIMYFYGDTSAMTKDNKVPLRIKYVSPNADKYGESFDLPTCIVGWQGTSSLQYARKNYKLKLKDAIGNKFKYSPYQNGILEDVFCLKADYMESSHANNTGAAKFINDLLYDSKVPPQEIDPNVRTTINGFPIMLYIAQSNTTDPIYHGIYNFNLDKSCTDSFGFNTETYPECVSFEVSANSDTSAGAFQDDTMSAIESEFELRFPDADGMSEEQNTAHYTKLQRLITWVKNATEEEFKVNLAQYFNKEFLLKYYIQVLTFGMVDNLGKNMMLTTWDGNIWYPQFYDLDTQLGLDNTGYLKFDSDIDIKVGIFNTSNSKLWQLVSKCFESEIADMYKAMRQKQYTTENIFKYLYDEQINKIGALQYNEDAVAKYISFKNDYLFMLHGNRYEHIKKWLAERLLYLDSYFGYEADISQSIALRANKSGSVYLNINTYSPQYVRVVWKNGVEQKLKVGKDTNGVMVPAKFTGTLSTATDQEVIIYNARHIKTITNMSGLNPSVINITEAIKLVELSVTSTYLKDVRINANNKLLRKLNLNGCTALGTASASGATFDLSEAINLVELDVNKTKLTSVILPEKGCNITKLSLPETLLSLRIVNINNLRTLNFSPIHELTELRLETDGTNGGFDISIFHDKIKALKYYFKGCQINVEELFLLSSRLESFEMYEMEAPNSDIVVISSATELDPHIKKFKITGHVKQMSITPASFTSDISELDLRGCKNIGLGAPTNIETLRISSDCQGLLIGLRLSEHFYRNLSREEKEYRICSANSSGADKNIRVSTVKRTNQSFFNLSNIVVDDDLPSDVVDLSRVTFTTSFRLLKLPCVKMFNKKFLINCDFSNARYDALQYRTEYVCLTASYIAGTKYNYWERGADMYLFPNMEGQVKVNRLCASGFYCDTISSEIKFGSRDGDYNINYFSFFDNANAAKVDFIGESNDWAGFYYNANVKKDIHLHGRLRYALNNAKIEGNVLVDNFIASTDMLLVQTATANITGKLTLDCSDVELDVNPILVGDINEIDIINLDSTGYFIMTPFGNGLNSSKVSFLNCSIVTYDGYKNGYDINKLIIDSERLTNLRIESRQCNNLEYLGLFPVFEQGDIIIYVSGEFLQDGINQLIVKSEQCTALNIDVFNSYQIGLVDIDIPNGNLEADGINSQNITLRAANIKYGGVGNISIDCPGDVYLSTGSKTENITPTFLSPCSYYNYTGYYNGPLSFLSSIDGSGQPGVDGELTIINNTDRVLQLDKLKELYNEIHIDSTIIEEINAPLLTKISDSKEKTYFAFYASNKVSLSFNFPVLSSFSKGLINFTEVDYDDYDSMPIYNINAPKLLLTDFQGLIYDKRSHAPKGIYNITLKEGSTLGVRFDYSPTPTGPQQAGTRYFFGDCNFKITGSFVYYARIRGFDTTVYEEYIRNLINLLDENSTVQNRVMKVNEHVLTYYPYFSDEVIEKGWAIQSVEADY